MGVKADHELDALATAFATALAAELGARAIDIARAQHDSATDKARAAWARVVRALEHPAPR